MASTAVAVQKKKASDLEYYFSQKKDMFASACVGSLTPERVIRVALMAAARVPKLYECSPSSMMLSVMNALALGLEIDGYHAHLVPFGTDAQLVVDYKGFVNLMHQSGQVAGVKAGVVREGDYFDFEHGTNEFLKHKPVLSSDAGSPADDEKTFRCVYAMARVKGEPTFVVLDRAYVLRRKAVSKTSGRSDSPWQKWPEEMWKKTAVKALVKFLPTSAEVASGVRLDDRAEIGAKQFAISPIAAELESAGQEEDEQEATSMRQQLESRFDDEPEDVPFTVPADEPSGMTPYEKWKAALDDCQTQTQANECLKDGLEWADGEMAQRMKNAADIRKGEIRNSRGSQKSFTE